MKYEKVIKISKEEAEQINKYLHEEPSCEEECLSEDTTIINTAIFDNGFEMDIKCCGVQYDVDNGTNTAWTEAVLFEHGYEVSCSDVSDEYLGEWTLEDDDNNKYVVIVEIEK